MTPTIAIEARESATHPLQGVGLMAPKRIVAPGISRPAHPPTARRDPEALLVERLRAGDEAAFVELVSSNGGRMLAAVQRLLRNEEEARDAVQDAFLSAFKAIRTFNGESKLSTWLHRIALNAALMRLRSRRQRAERPIDDLLPHFDAEGSFAQEPSRWVAASDELLENRETRVMVRRCIDRLPEQFRTVLLMRDIEDLDTDEVTALLGTTANAVKIRLHRARQALRTLVAEELRDDSSRAAA